MTKLGSKVYNGPGNWSSPAPTHISLHIATPHLLYLPAITMLALSTLLLLGSALAAPAPVPSGGVGVRLNDTPPVYGVMSECEYMSFSSTLIS